MPMSSITFLDNLQNILVFEERNYDHAKTIAEHEDLFRNLTAELKNVYESVMDAINNEYGGFFFVYGSGGCGKTYLCTTIIAKLRSESKIVLLVASSGIAATLLSGGRTTHSSFKIPLKLDDSSTCAIRHNSDIAELLKQTSLIIWYEAPMQNMYAFECLDRSLCDIMKSVDNDRYDKPFGGITMLLGGDFRQILPVVTRSSCCDIVSACILRSTLWASCKMFHLSKNMRLTNGDSKHSRLLIQEFSEWVLDIGDGKIDWNDHNNNDDGCSIRIPSEFCILSHTASIDLLIDNVFPDLSTRYTDHKYLRERAILTPKNKVVDHVNSLILEKIPGESFAYHSVDPVKCPVSGGDHLSATFPHFR